MTDMWGDLVWTALADLKTRLLLVLPGILAMLTLTAVGLAAAWLGARVIRRLSQAVAFDRRAETWGIVAALHRAGVTQVYGGGMCTFSDPKRFYSYRRDRVTGRMAALVWRER